MVGLVLSVLVFLCDGVLTYPPYYQYPVFSGYYPHGVHNTHYDKPNYFPYGYNQYGHHYGHQHEHKPGCGHLPQYPSYDSYEYTDYEDSKTESDLTTTPNDDTLDTSTETSIPDVITSEEPKTTLEPTTTTEPTFELDIRFGKNKTVTKRSTKEMDPTQPTYSEHNSLHPYGFWNFPDFSNAESPNGLATCIQKKYECVPINKCKPAQTANNQRFCRWSGNTPFVCCEKQQGNKLLQRHDVSCGRKKASVRSAAIVGGASVAEGHAFPWMVAIGQLSREGEVDWFCGGALISAQTVVTAAHCIGRRSPDIIRLGEIDLKKSVLSNNIQDIYVWRSLVHPSYRPPAMYTDIALLFLDKPAKFSQFVRPVCLPQKLAGTPLGLLTGWGKLSFDGDKSPILQEVTVKVFNNSQCDKFYSVGTATKRNFPRGILDTQMCAGDEEGGKDACQGDSGSPMVIEEDGSMVLTGIVSAGIGCGAKIFPGIYTRVSSFVPWLLENMI